MTLCVLCYAHHLQLQGETSWIENLYIWPPNSYCKIKG